MTIGQSRLPFDREPTVVEGVLIKIGVLAGDGVGPEVVGRGSRGSRGGRADSRDSSMRLVRFDLGGERYLRPAKFCPTTRSAVSRGCDAILLGAVGDPGSRREFSRRAFCSGFGLTSSST